MPAPATVPEFLELVRKSGLAPENKLDELLGRHRATGAPQSVDQTAGLLVRDGQLTFFQAKQLKLGRYKRFTIGSKYRLLELIGAGGMGAVYLCEHTLMKRLVALKVLPVEKLDDPSNLDRFHREARAVAALDHPNIVRAYDIDQYDKLHFLVMEYVDGHIPVARLNALPFSTLCVKCQRDMEADGGRYGSHGELDWGRITDGNPMEDRDITISDLERST